MKKLILTLLLISWASLGFCATELDYMEYSSDAAAQAAYVSSEASDIKESYTEANYSADGSIDGFHPTASSTERSARGQAFTAGSTFHAIQVKFYAKKIGSPTGNAFVRLYATTGTVGTDAKPTGAALASSAAFDVSTLTTSYALYTFTLTVPYNLSNGADYAVVFENPASGTIDGSNIVVLGFDNTSPSHGGNQVFFHTSAWQANNSADAIFYIYGVVLNAFSEATIKQQGSYSLKGIARATASLNDTLTRTVSPVVDLTGITSIKFDIYSSRTGSNIKIGIHDSGGTTTEITPNITSAGAWQTVTWDISAVSDANKDAIDSIIITNVNADADNIFYVDNMYGESAAGEEVRIYGAIASGVGTGIGRGLR